jgi:hypothetical protein
MHVSSDEESEARSGDEAKEEDESEGGFVTERKEPVHRWGVALAENKAFCRSVAKTGASESLWEQFCKPRTGAEGW